MRMPSPFSTQAHRSAWVKGIQQTWSSSPVTQTADPSCGSGVRATSSSLWPLPSAWLWTSPPRRCLWLTVAPTLIRVGIVWMALFTLFIKWALQSTKAKLQPKRTIMILGSVEDRKMKSAGGHTVSVVFFLIPEGGSGYIHLGMEKKGSKQSVMELWELRNY